MSCLVLGINIADPFWQTDVISNALIILMMEWKR